MQCREFSIMADMCDKYYMAYQKNMFHRPKRNYRQEIDQLQPYRIFQYAKSSILIANINKFLIQKTSRGRSSLFQMIFKIDVFKDFAMFTGKHLCQSLFLIMLQAKVCNFIRKRLYHGCFIVVNIAKFLRTAFLYQNWWLLLKISYY